MAAGDITTQPKQGRQAGPMSRLCILLCLWGPPKEPKVSFITVVAVGCVGIFCCVFRAFFAANYASVNEPLSVREFFADVTTISITTLSLTDVIVDPA